MSHADRLAHAAACDAEFAFLEDPNASLGEDLRAGVGVGSLSDTLIGVKSNIAVVGQSWTAGIRGRASILAKQDAGVVRILRGAGAGFLSRLTMDEAALGAATEASGFRKTQNPSARGYSVGGSSGGAAAAVASGAVPIALGSDTLGSVRIPAAYCGVLGLKPGRDVLPMDGVFPLARGFDTLGLLAARTDDIRAVLGLFQSVSKVSRASVLQAVPEVDVQRAPQVAAGVNHAQEALAQQGLWAGLRPLKGWDARVVRKAAFGLVCAQATQTLASEPLSGKAVKEALLYGARLSPSDLQQAQDVCGRVVQSLHDALADGAVLMTPTTPTPAFPQGEAPPSSQADFTVLANLAGVPALAVPVGAAALPCSVQLMAAPGYEATLLDLADVLMAKREINRTPV